MAIKFNGNEIKYPIKFNGTEFKKVMFNGQLAFWKFNVTAKTSSYWFIGEKKVQIHINPLPPVDVKMTMTMGNGNSGSVWTTRTLTIPATLTDTSDWWQIASTKTDYYATVVVKLEIPVLGTTYTLGGTNVTKGPLRAYQIGVDKDQNLGDHIA